MSKLVIIKVTNNINKFIDKCIKYKIDLLNITYLDKNSILVKVYIDDLDKIYKLNYFSEIIEYRSLGFNRFINFIKRNIIVFITVISCFFMMFFLENVIFDINVIHSNKEIINLIETELEKNNIRTFTFVKKFDEIEKIRLKIIEDNPEKLEWISITRVGMKYIVRVEERILTEVEENDKYCHVVAKKAGIIKKIKSTSGEIIPVIDDYVRAGDILISGQIHLYEEVKDNICALGEVYAEVWYNVNVSIPLEYQEKNLTGEERYNFIVDKKKLFNEKYEFYSQEDIYKFNILGFNVKYIKEKEYINIMKKYTYEEAIDEALKQVDEKMMVKLKNNGEIISKKILKKTQFNSRIDIEVFVITLENIAKKQNYDIKGDDIDTE